MVPMQKKACVYVLSSYSISVENVRGGRLGGSSLSCHLRTAGLLLDSCPNILHQKCLSLLQLVYSITPVNVHWS